MRIDHDTLRDLEIHGGAPGVPGLVDHLNRARTRGGREAFRRRLTQPLESAAEIQAVQQTLRYIAAQRAVFEALPAEGQIADLTRYLNSRITTLGTLGGPAASFESLWIRLRYPDLYLEAKRGTQLVTAFLSTIRKLIADLEEPPTLLAAYVHEMQTMLRTSRLRLLQARAPRFGGPVNTFLRDRAARDGGRMPLRRLIELVFEIDALLSMSDVTVEKGYAFPTVDQDFRGIELRDLYHPFLQKPVVNDLQFAPGTRLVFLTGPNMAGKSTYLKACGIAVLLSHTGMGVPAREGRIGVLDRLVTAIRTEDNLRAGVSYFQAEARRVREVAQLLTDRRRCLVIADELFRGTNVKDACDASLTVLETFARVPNGFFLVASHLTELADALEQLRGVLLRCFDAALHEERVDFDYRIRSGVSAQRLGMKVLDKEGVLEILATLRASSEAPDVTAHGA